MIELEIYVTRRSTFSFGRKTIRLFLFGLRKHMLRRSLESQPCFTMSVCYLGRTYTFLGVNRYDVRMRKGNQMEYRQSDGRIVLMKVGNATGGKSRTDNIYPATRHHIKGKHYLHSEVGTNNDNQNLRESQNYQNNIQK